MPIDEARSMAERAERDPICITVIRLGNPYREFINGRPNNSHKIFSKIIAAKTVGDAIKECKSAELDYGTWDFNQAEQLGYIVLETPGDQGQSIFLVPDLDAEHNPEEFPIEKEKFRAMVTSHLAWERDATLAKVTKENAEYKCFVCSERPRDKYGEIGGDYAEAHHKIPLSQLDGPVRTKADDLICVCANCHRILHRLISSGIDDPVPVLKAWVENSKKEGTWTT